jgi:hypothetical protein
MESDARVAMDMVVELEELATESSSVFDGSESGRERRAVYFTNGSQLIY